MNIMISTDHRFFHRQHNVKTNRICHRSPMQTEKSQPEGKRKMPETTVGFSRSAPKTDD